MTCAEVLESLATASLRDMTADSAVMSHCATCPDCARVTTMLREKEYEAASVLNDLPPMSNPVTVAEQSVVTSKRRRVGRVAVIATGTALVATIWIAASLTIVPQLNHADARFDSELRTETMQLTCLSPQQAGDIINPYVRSHGSSYYIPSSGISAITVRGTVRELAKSRDLVAQFESDPGAACKVKDGAAVNSMNDPRLIQAVEDEARGGIVGAGAAVPAKVADKAPAAPKSR
ncbi:MAG: hypothetical protein ACR2NS_00050 [Gemmatimonadaceae bacterium]